MKKLDEIKKKNKNDTRLQVWYKWYDTVYIRPFQLQVV